MTIATDAYDGDDIVNGDEGDALLVGNAGHDTLSGGLGCAMRRFMSIPLAA